MKAIHEFIPIKDVINGHFQTMWIVSTTPSLAMSGLFTADFSHMTKSLSNEIC